jgi:hypothetical protein
LGTARSFDCNARQGLGGSLSGSIAANSEQRRMQCERASARKETRAKHGIFPMRAIALSI